MPSVVKLALRPLCLLAPLLLAAPILMVSCESPQKKALRALSQKGIVPSGKALLESVQRGNVRETKLLAEAGVHTGHRDELGRTPLQIAIEKHDLTTAGLLLDAGGDVNAIDRTGTSVLGYALHAGETVLADRLLRAGAKADGHMPGGETILPWAIREGQLALVERAIESGADPHMTDAKGNSLVNVAVESDHHEILGLLLDRGADTTHVNAAGDNLLHSALDHGWTDLVPRLLKAGTDPNVPDAKGITPLEHAIQARDPNLLGLFLGAGANPNRPNPTGETPVEEVLKAKWPEARSLLMKSGVDFNQPDANGKTPLDLAMDRHDCDLAEELVRAGAKPAKDGWSGWFARSLVSGDVTVVRRLLGMGVSSNRRLLGYLPTEIASLQGNGSMLRVLLDAGAPAGDSLYLACTAGDRGVASLLMAYGYSPNPSRAPWLDTPLGAAIRAGSDSLVATLLARGAHPFLPTGEGQSPLHLAITMRRPVVVSLLLAKGANPNAPFILPVKQAFLKHVKSSSMRYVLKSDRNVTPLMLAAVSGEVATTAHLLKAGAKKDVTTRTTHYWPINFASTVGDIPMMRVMLGRDPKVEERVIVISLSEQRAHVYNQNGEEIYTTKVSTGKPGFGTPTGEFAITDKNREWTSTLYHASMPFFQRLNGAAFGMHQGVVPGYPASHGCIRVPAGNAEKLFAMTQTGDRVKIVP